MLPSGIARKAAASRDRHEKSGHFDCPRGSYDEISDSMTAEPPIAACHGGTSPVLFRASNEPRQVSREYVRSDGEKIANQP
jgi:hypothetical protein